MAKTGRHLFTSESVTEGHPDKIADQISDAVLDAALADDPASRVACETLVTTGLVVVAGEITTETYVPVAKLVREVVRGIGYDHSTKGFDCDTQACQCEHGDHEDPATGTHTYLGVPAGAQRAEYVGAICDTCAIDHLADYLR